MIYVILFIVIVYIFINFILFIMNVCSVNYGKVIAYYERIPFLPQEVFYEIVDFICIVHGDNFIRPTEINNESDFHESFNALISAMYEADRVRRNVKFVNMLAIFMVKYYGIFIVEWGTLSEKGVFGNCVRLLKMNNIL